MIKKSFNINCLGAISIKAKIYLIILILSLFAGYYAYHKVNTVFKSYISNIEHKNTITPKSIETHIQSENIKKKELQVLKINNGPRETVVFFTLSGQTGFGATRVTDGTIYTLTLYNTHLSPSFEKPNIDTTQDTNIFDLNYDNIDHDLILTFKIPAHVIITQLSYQTETSNILILKLTDLASANMKKDLQNIKADNNGAKTEEQEQVKTTEQEYQKAAVAFSANNLQDASTLLEKILISNPGYHEARRLLIFTLLQMGKLTQAYEVVDKGLALDRDNIDFIKIKAKMLTEEEGQEQMAINLLLKHNPKIEEEQDYYAMLAALYQKTSKYTKALHLYMQLIKIQSNNGLYWAGLGIVADNLHNTNQAIIAYEKAIQLGGVASNLTEHINDRLTALKNR